MHRKPLAYVSLKTVLQHMGPEIRFELTRRVPQIRLTEAVVPLKISFLELGENFTKINGTTYEMRTYHDYDQGVTVPKYIRNRNKNGGLTVDYDRFGHRDDSFRNVLTAGDLDFRDGRVRTLNTLKLFLQPYIFERRNQSPPWRNVIRLSITSRKKDMKVHQLPFSCRLHEAEKFLNKLLVCRGNPVVNVKTLKISNSGYILRMPVNLKLKINNLDGKVENSFYKALNKIIHESSYPLNSVYVNCISNNVNVLDHPLITDAKTLKVSDVTIPRGQRLPLLLKMQNPTVLVDSVGFLKINGVVGLIINLKESIPPIGHKIRLNVLGFNAAFESLKQFANQFDGTRIRGRTITIPMNHISTLQVSYTPKNRKTRDNGHFYLEMIVLSNNN
ncbi:hypothetical protein CRE_17359 [Caenorhabditis remanei]|uniref:Uncharacterized protein n=1 Tax=Caenorhabditis remanei TaxID=31234 RepID=E3MS32_CAERE|nr:hypothetical protein CRE_17359 [Caenorhabditis remanei]